MKRRRPSSFFPLAFLPAVLAGDRTITITNSCDETIWTAVTNFGDTKAYTGPGGFEQKSGNTTTLTMPSPNNFRIWPRRSCTFDDSGAGSCVTGDCSGKLECVDDEIGTVNVGEFNLDSWAGNDFWDQSCVPGWTIPMKIAPEGDGCDSVSCTTDVNAACPDDRMKVKDDAGNTLACIAACFAGINADEPSMNCCSGKYNSLDACVSDQVDYYDVLKPMCEHAYWYPYDSRDNYPTVDYACSASGDPGYTIEYCPDGSGTGIAAGDSASSTDGQTGLASPTPSTTGGSGSTKTGSGDSSKTTGSGGSADGGTAASTGKPASQTASHSSSSTSSSNTAASPSSSSSSNASTSDDTILGLSQPVFYAMVAVLLLLVLLAIGVALFHRRSPPPAPQRVPSSETSSDSGSSGSSSSGSESDDSGDEDEGESARSLARRPLPPDSLPIEEEKRWAAP
ncbi:hypothetical protein JCM10207_003711 [Rhodosporidiobolus poonsookiae]